MNYTYNISHMKDLEDLLLPEKDRRQEKDIKKQIMGKLIWYEKKI